MERAMKRNAVKQKDKLAHQIQLRQIEIEYKKSSQVAQYVNANAVVATNIETIPLSEFDHGETHISMFHTPFDTLEVILEMARDPERCKKITKADISYIYKEYNYEHIKNYYI